MSLKKKGNEYKNKYTNYLELIEVIIFFETIQNQYYLVVGSFQGKRWKGLKILDFGHPRLL